MYIFSAVVEFTEIGWGFPVVTLPLGPAVGGAVVSMRETWTTLT